MLHFLKRAFLSYLALVQLKDEELLGKKGLLLSLPTPRNSLLARLVIYNGRLNTKKRQPATLFGPFGSLKAGRTRKNTAALSMTGVGAITVQSLFPILAGTEKAKQDARAKQER